MKTKARHGDQKPHDLIHTHNVYPENAILLARSWALKEIGKNSIKVKQKYKKSSISDYQIG